MSKAHPFHSAMWNGADTGAMVAIRKNEVTTCSSSRASLITVLEELGSSSLSSRSLMEETLRRKTSRESHWLTCYFNPVKV